MPFSNILKSASKLVFLMLALSACIGFFMGILEPKDFMLLAVSAFSFYFAYKPKEVTQPMESEPIKEESQQ